MPFGTRHKPGSVLAAAAGVLLAAVHPAAGAVGTIMFVVANSASLTSEESAKKALMEGWGYTVSSISATATQASYDAAAKSASCAYISETVNSTDVGTKMTNFTIGVVNEEAALSDEFGFSASMTTFSDTQINIINTSHYITSTLSSGNQAIFTSSQPVRYLSGAAGSFTTLGRQVSTTNATLAILNRGDTLTPSGAAAGKRVYLPFGNTGYLPGSLNTAGLAIMQRSIEWALLPVSHWKLNEGSGTTAADWIGGHNATISGATWTTGRIAGGLRLNGSTDYISVAHHTDYNVTTALTIAGWIKGTSWAADPNWASIILRKGDANPNPWQLCVSQSRAKLVLDDYDAYGIMGNTTLATGKWYHLAGTWDGTTAKVYVNGVLDMTPVSYAAPIPTNTQSVYIGGRTTGTDVTDGVVDDVRFYNRCLTAAEIADLAKAAPTMQSWKQSAPP